MAWVLWLVWVYLMVCLVSLTGLLFILNWQAYRRWMRLNALLHEICWKAFLNQHMPIWNLWSEFTGMSYRIMPIDKSQLAAFDARPHEHEN